MKNLKTLFVLLAVICLASCGVNGNSGSKLQNPPKHVILIGFDGLSSYCINNGANMPVFRKLMAEGASTVENRSVLPSSSAVNWASMFMGQVLKYMDIQNGVAGHRSCLRVFLQKMENFLIFIISCVKKCLKQTWALSMNGKECAIW